MARKSWINIRIGIIAILIAHINVLIDAAGFSTHNLAARKTSQFEYFGPSSTTFNPSDWNGLAAYRSDAIQGGAPFPDYLYTCGDDHDAGETAHWTPFQIAAVDYIRATYPNWASEGRDSAGAGLVAFFLGVNSHYIADMNWHGLETVPSGEGIIRTMGFADFNCTDGDLCSIAHTAADTGGEFAAAKMVDLKWYPQKKWYIPTTDLVNIYAAMNTTVQESWIKECAVIFYAGSFAVSRLGDIIYDHIIASRVGALMLEEYLEFPVGGVDDNAAWTGFVWNRFADWVVDGPPDTPPNAAPASPTSINFSKKRISQRRFAQAIKKLLASEDGAKFQPLFIAQTVSYPNGNDGAFVGVRDDVATTSPGQTEHDKMVMSAIAKYLVTDYVSELVDINNQGNDMIDLVTLEKVLTSRIDAVLAEAFVADKKTTSVPAAKTSSTDVNIATVEIEHGSAAHEYFGSSITTADFSGANKGQHCDLLVGSFGTGRSGGPQEGSAQILFGAACGLANSSAATSKEKLMFRGGMNHDTPLPSYERFGYATAALDINTDLHTDAVICAPSFGGRNVSAVVGNYSGRCDVFLGPFAPSDTLPSPALSIYGDAMWGLFGRSVAVGDVDGDGLNDLIIGAPGAGSYASIAPNSRGDVSSQGSVHVFLHKSLASKVRQSKGSFVSLLASVDADYTIQNADSFEYFGQTLEIVPKNRASSSSGPLLLVGAPYFKIDSANAASDDNVNSAVGRVFAYSFAEKGKVTAAFEIAGCRHASRVGQSLAYSSALDVLAIAEPSHNVTNKLVDNRFTKVLRAGRVLLVPMSSLVSKKSESGVVNVCDIETWPEVGIVEGKAVDGRFGAQMKFMDASSKLPARTQSLIVSAPVSSEGGELYGVNVVSTEGSLHAKIEWSVSGASLGEVKGRLGYRLATTDDGNVLASLPLADIGGVAPDGDQVGSVRGFVVTKA